MTNKNIADKHHENGTDLFMVCLMKRKKLEFGKNAKFAYQMSLAYGNTTKGEGDVSLLVELITCDKIVELS